MTEHQDITDLLKRWSAGDRGAESQVMNALFPKLHEIASIQRTRFGGNQTMQVTELVSELYLKLKIGTIEPNDRGHFFAVAAKAVRYLLTDGLRTQMRAKRSGERVRLAIEQIHTDALVDDTDPTDWLAVDEAIRALENEDPTLAELAELKVFAGQTIEEIAAITGRSRSDVVRRWRFTKAWLRQYLEGTKP